MPSAIPLTPVYLCALAWIFRAGCVERAGWTQERDPEIATATAQASKLTHGNRAVLIRLLIRSAVPTCAAVQLAGLEKTPPQQQPFEPRAAGLGEILRGV